MMELFNQNVDKYLKKNNPKQGTCYEILRQMLSAIEEVHKLGLLHLDIKPSNFVISNENEDVVNVKLIDFGLSKLYRKQNGDLIPKRENGEFRGTVSYASVNAHKKVDLSPRDDLWSFLFVLLEIAQIPLPWRCERLDKDVVLKLKEDFIQNPEFFIKDCIIQNEIFQLVKYLNSLDFYDTPDYEFIRNILLWINNKDILNRKLPCNETSAHKSTENLSKSFLGHKRGRNKIPVNDSERTLSD
jgi:serine/threonine protein kinase